MAQILPPELIQKIANQSDLQTYYRISQTCKRLHRLLIPSNLYFSPTQLMEAVAHRDTERVEKWLKTEYFQSSVFNTVVPTRYGNVRLTDRLMDYACRWGVPKAVEILLKDARLHDEQYDFWFPLNFMGPDPEAAFDIFRLLFPRYRPLIYGIVLQSVEFGKDRIFDILFDLQLRQDEQLGALAYATMAGRIHVASRLMTLPDFDEHLKSFLRGEDYNGAPKTVEFMEYVMQGRDYIEYDFYNVLCWAMRDGQREIAEFLRDRVDVSHYGLRLALSGCMHGYFDLVRHWLKSEDWQYVHKEELLQKSDFEIFQHFYCIPGISLDHLDGPFPAYCVSSTRVVDYMISKGADVSELLMESIGTGPVDVIEYILAMEGIDFSNYSSGLAFQASRYRRGSDVLSLLLRDPRTRFRENILAPACNACDDGNFEWVRTLLKTMQIVPKKDVDRMTDPHLYIYVDRLCGLQKVSGKDFF
ncbi:hypothetical protein EDD86DRAFT_248435 [Gorgonomyces haynaldii]|nr:hypothetical protein EDD86DRAFT_248435 [Gorgonomyces haynaldii]